MSYLALFQTTLNHECDPSFSDAAPAPLVPVVVTDAEGDAGVLLADEVLGDGLVADAEGDAVVDADTVGVALVGGASVVGVAEVRLGVGLAGRVAVVWGTVSTLVPGAVPLACDVRTDAVVGAPSFEGAGGVEVEPFNDECWPPELSSTATIAATPHSATPIPAAARRRRPRGEPGARSEY